MHSQKHAAAILLLHLMVLNKHQVVYVWLSLCDCRTIVVDRKRNSVLSTISYDTFAQISKRASWKRCSINRIRANSTNYHKKEEKRTIGILATWNINAPLKFFLEEIVRNIGCSFEPKPAHS